MSPFQDPSLQTSPGDPSAAVLAQARTFLESRGFTVVASDGDRPWGGFLVIAEDQARDFIRSFFPDLDPDAFGSGVRLSPKFLLVAPGARLSWQYHHRRSEIWRALSGRVGVVRSPTDEQGEVVELSPGDQVRLAKGERHRLVGLDGWGILAEIWRHEDTANPSSEDDIVRVSDDYGR